MKAERQIFTETDLMGRQKDSQKKRGHDRQVVREADICCQTGKQTNRQKPAKQYWTDRQRDR